MQKNASSTEKETTASDEHERRMLVLSDAEMEKIAERAADIAWENLQREVGKATIKSALYIVGLGLFALLTWLGITERLKL